MQVQALCPDHGPLNVGLSECAVLLSMGQSRPPTLTFLCRTCAKGREMVLTWNDALALKNGGVAVLQREKFSHYHAIHMFAKQLANDSTIETYLDEWRQSAE